MNRRVRSRSHRSEDVRATARPQHKIVVSGEPTAASRPDRSQDSGWKSSTYQFPAVGRRLSLRVGRRGTREVPPARCPDTVAAGRSGPPPRASHPVPSCGITSQAVQPRRADEGRSVSGAASDVAQDLRRRVRIALPSARRVVEPVALLPSRFAGRLMPLTTRLASLVARCWLRSRRIRRARQRSLDPGQQRHQGLLRGDRTGWLDPDCAAPRQSSAASLDGPTTIRQMTLA